MTKKTHIDNNGNSWEWEETPDTIKALERLHEDMRKAKEKESNLQRPKRIVV